MAHTIPRCPSLGLSYTALAESCVTPIRPPRPRDAFGCSPPPPLVVLPVPSHHRWSPLQQGGPPSRLFAAFLGFKMPESHGQGLMATSTCKHSQRLAASLPGAAPDSAHAVAEITKFFDSGRNEQSATEFEGMVQDLVAGGYSGYSQHGGVHGQCAACGAHAAAVPGGRLKRCARCHSVFYCSERCQRRHWKRGHKTTCTASPPAPKERNAPAFAPPVVNGRELKTLSPWALSAQLGKTDAPFRFHAWAQLDECAEEFRTYVQRDIARPQRTWPRGTRVDRLELAGGLVDQLRPLLLPFFLQGERSARARASAQGRAFRPGAIVIESHGRCLEDVFGPATGAGPRHVAVHHLPAAGLVRYFTQYCTDSEAARQYGPVSLAKLLPDLGLGPGQSAPADVLRIFVSMQHRQGGPHGYRHCPTPASSGPAPAGHASFAHTYLMVPLSPADGAALGDAGVGMLRVGELHGAQLLEVDLALGKVLAVDFDESHFKTLVCAGSPGETASRAAGTHCLFDAEVDECDTETPGGFPVVACRRGPHRSTHGGGGQ